MICKHCGTQNPDTTRICTQCGMPLEENTAQNPVKQEETKNKTSKNVMKKKSLLLVIGIPLLAWLIGSAVGQKAGKEMSGGSNSSTTAETSVEDIIQKEDNPEYTKIFTERNIIKPVNITFGLNKASFAKVEVSEEGLETIDCYDIAYDASTGAISNMAESLYIDVSSYTEEELESLDTAMQEEYQAYQGENFTATFETPSLSSYYRVSLEYKNLDDEDVVKNLEDQGLITTTGTGTGGLGIKATENSLLSQGYVKK